MIHLVDNYYLDADDKQYILLEWDGSVSKLQNKDGSFSKQLKNQQYFSNFQYLLEKLTIIYARKSIAERYTLEQLGADLTAIKNIIESIGKRMWPDLDSITDTRD
jgi:hypothetical protein